MIKRFTNIIFALLISNTVVSQINHTIIVDPSMANSEYSSSIKPGIFYHQFWIPTQNSLVEYISEKDMYNTFRDNKFNSECWKWSTSQQDILNRMEENNLKSWLEWQQLYAEKVVVKFNAMPYWLSASDDWSIMADESWRVFMTHPPKNMEDWNTTIKAIVSKINSWGIHPYYEIWNEPDGMYWQATDAEMLELYKNTALSIKEIDTLAKVGAFGMHTWWRSVDPVFANEQNFYKSPVMGFLPDSIPEKYSILYDLMDSITGAWSEENVSLDFISYHFFNWNSYELIHTAQQLRNKMDELGYSPPGVNGNLTYPELYLSEWQTTYHIQEQVFQPGLFIRMMNRFEDAGIEMNSIAAINDFGTNENNEFTNGWGMFSQNALIKPVFKGLLLLSEITKRGQKLETDHGTELDVFSSISGDTLHMLVSNYSMPVWWYQNYYRFAWSCFEKLLYDSTSVHNAMDYQEKGLTSIYWGNSNNDYGSVDSIIMGLLEPPENLPESMASSLELSRLQYVYDSTANVVNHNLNIKLITDNDSLRVNYMAIDSNDNNIIFTYDSLINISAYSHNRAIDSLKSCSFPGGCYGLYSEFDSLYVGIEFSINIEPNTILYLTIPGLEYQPVEINVEKKQNEQIRVYPNPATHKVKIEANHKIKNIAIYNFAGLKVKELSINDISCQMNISQFSSGIYLFKITTEQGVIVKQVIFQ